jgi:succinoglycan biosynthesis transport protein ExoP
MSKNFELIQQAGMERQVMPDSGMNATSPSIKRNGNGNGNGHRNGSALDLGRVAREESLKLVQRIFRLQAGEPPHIVVFAGIDQGNGCSNICARAAQTLASEIPGSVCLVDANLRSPSLPEFFGVTNHRGLTNALLEEGPVRDFAKQLRPDNLWLLSCGSLAADSPSLLNTDRLRTRLAELREEFDHVLIDAPPLSQYADAISLGQLTDGLVLVVEANSTRRESAIKVMENVRRSNIQVLGAVLNKRTFPIPESLYHRL